MSADLSARYELRNRSDTSSSRHSSPCASMIGVQLMNIIDNNSSINISQNSKRISYEHLFFPKIWPLLNRENLNGTKSRSGFCIKLRYKFNRLDQPNNRTEHREINVKIIDILDEDITIIIWQCLIFTKLIGGLFSILHSLLPLCFFLKHYIDSFSITISIFG